MAADDLATPHEEGGTPLASPHHFYARLSMSLPRSPGRGLRPVELGSSDIHLLQQFFAANPEYFLNVQREPALPNDAQEEIEEDLPTGIPYASKWVIGFTNPDGSLAAMANVVSDIFKPTVWNLSTFIVATELHGSGVACLLYEAIEAWATQSGARWFRLGVVVGNTRAERFWLSRGFVEMRIRTDYQIGQQLNTLRVMSKPLAGGSIAEYLTLVVRDAPGAQLNSQ